jgi:hypothetical protein
MGYALVRNNANTTLAVAIGTTDVSIQLAAGTGARFPTIAGGSGNYFYLTLLDVSNNIEVIKVVGTSTDILTVVRGQDSTTARSYAIGSRAELRPTAALFNDKMPVGGGTFTGAIEVPASASGSQAPRVSEVVKKAGDSMGGPLILPELRGSSNEILIPAGHRIKAETGGLIAPGMVIQTLHKRVDTVVSYVSSVNTPVEVAAMTFSITPKYSNSKILLTYDMTFEASSGSQYVFRLTRNGSQIGQNTAVAAANWVGWKIPVYDPDDSSTPTSQVMTYMDEPASTSVVEYKIQVFGSNGNAVTFRLNRAYGGADVGQANYEIGTSSIMLQEIAQ